MYELSIPEAPEGHKLSADFGRLWLVVMIDLAEEYRVRNSFIATAIFYTAGQADGQRIIHICNESYIRDLVNNLVRIVNENTSLRTRMAAKLVAEKTVELMNLANSWKLIQGPQSAYEMYE